MADEYAALLTHDIVPRTPQANALWRKSVIHICERDPVWRQRFWDACAKDVLFWLNTFAILFEPRDILGPDGRPQQRVFPMITWPHQEPVILELRNGLGREDFLMKKSRAEGASWIACLLAVHDWVFRSDTEIGLCSATEKKADNEGDRGSLMGKIVWEIRDCLPKWMVGEENVDWVRRSSEHTLINQRNNSVIKAFAATRRTGRGDRFFYFIPDELAEWDRGPDGQLMDSLQHATNSRFVISTPQGSDGEYHRICTEATGYKHVTLWWWDNPTKNRGLYRMIDGRPKAVDPKNNPLPEHYQKVTPEVSALLARLTHRGFDFSSKKLRSPWYDRECDRARSPQSIASELDGDFSGSELHVFGDKFMAAAAVFCQPEYHRGIFTFNRETLEGEFEETPDGPVKLWMELDSGGVPPVKPYVLGADIADGHAESYKSNSVLIGVDQVTRHQVLEFALSNLEPGDFTDYCIAIAMWMHNAYLAWEINGPGRRFTSRVKERKYMNNYRRHQLWHGTRKVTKELGWHTNADSKEAMFGDLTAAVKDREFILRSRDIAREASQYVRDERGRIKFVGIDAEDKTHGDRVIASAVCWQAMKVRPLDKSHEKKNEVVDENMVPIRNPPPNTMAAREVAWHRRRQDESEDDVEKRCSVAAMFENSRDRSNILVVD